MIDKDAINTKKINIVNNKIYDKYDANGVWINPYQTKQTLAFSAPVKIYNKRIFNVVLPQNLLLSNAPTDIQKIEINFDDNKGYHVLNYNQIIQTSYIANGIYNWVFKVTLISGEILFSQTKIKIDAKDIQDTTAYENNVYIPSPQPLESGATLRIDYANSHNGQIVKPFIVAEGFDPRSILSPEIEGGSLSINNFMNDIRFRSGNQLRALLDFNQQYDIIYIDWENGTNSIQHNSEVLKEVIAWVNSNKQGNEPNVLLGQSMGGVIGRYTLATMEAEGINHNVKLFISHDAPMQGSNTPISMQYFSRHAYDQYTSVPQLYDFVEIAIPTILNMIDLMDIHNTIDDNNLTIPSPNDYLTLQDTPAAMQMNYYYVDMDSNPTTLIHDAWQQELDNVGYPTQCRNIAISNGNECAVDHGFNPRDKFISLHDTHDPGFWGDLLDLIVTPTIGYLIDDPALHFLGQLPGNSSYHFDFDLYANPDINQSERKVYKGKITYKKKLFWFITITHTIMNRSKYAPNGYLPFDTYSGGFIDLEESISSISGSIPSNTIVNPRYGFIPVVSSLDIKRNNHEVSPNDYLKNYAGGQTPETALTTPFDNFIVDFNQDERFNYAHISFQPRNGNWLANELEEATVLIDDCSAFCDNQTIEGSNRICSSETYYITNTATTVNWTISDPNNLVNSTINGSEITINTVNSSKRGTITLSVTYGSPTCGTATISKIIKVGKPIFPSASMSGNTNVTPSNFVSYSVQPAQGATSYYWSIDIGSEIGVNVGGWQIYNGQGTTSVDFRVGSSSYPSVVIRCEAINSCGRTMKYKYITVSNGGSSGDEDPCDPIYELRKTNETNRYNIEPIDDPCDPNNLNNISSAQLYNAYGVEEQGIIHQGNEIELNNVQPNTIKIIRVVVDDKVIIKRIITD